MEILGYIGAVLIGLSLGMIGSGGSILTVPVLVYLIGVDPVRATAYSLFIVGITAAVGGIQKFREGAVDARAALLFGIPSIIAVFLTRKFMVPAIPDVVFASGNLIITKGTFLLILFAILMLLAAFTMIRSNGNQEIVPVQQKKPPMNIPLVTMEGVFVGILTGLVGAGGGFLIIPALVLLRKLPMKTAIGTSLLIIAAKSLIGFTGDLMNMSMGWPLLLGFSGLAILGIFAGNRFSRNIEATSLRKAFGWFVLLMGIYILIRETVLHH